MDRIFLMLGSAASIAALVAVSVGTVNAVGVADATGAALVVAIGAGTLAAGELPVANVPFIRPSVWLTCCRSAVLHPDTTTSVAAVNAAQIED